jgi:uncharacterized protein (UPF0210 family)
MKTPIQAIGVDLYDANREVIGSCFERSTAHVIAHRCNAYDDLTVTVMNLSSALQARGATKADDYMVRTAEELLAQLFFDDAAW